MKPLWNIAIISITFFTQVNVTSGLEISKNIIANASYSYEVCHKYQYITKINNSQVLRLVNIKDGQTGKYILHVNSVGNASLGINCTIFTSETSVFSAKTYDVGNGEIMFKGAKINLINPSNCSTRELDGLGYISIHLLIPSGPYFDMVRTRHLDFVVYRVNRSDLSTKIIAQGIPLLSPYTRLIWGAFKPSDPQRHFFIARSAYGSETNIKIDIYNQTYSYIRTLSSEKHSNENSVRAISNAHGNLSYCNYDAHDLSHNTSEEIFVLSCRSMNGEFKQYGEPTSYPVHYRSDDMAVQNLLGGGLLVVRTTFTGSTNLEYFHIADNGTVLEASVLFKSSSSGSYLYNNQLLIDEVDAHNKVYCIYFSHGGCHVKTFHIKLI